MKNQTIHMLAAAVMLTAAGAASALDVQLPGDTVTYKESTLPGYALVQKNCMTCHSAHYAQMQPPNMGKSYWEATVKKMKKPFGAQFDDAEVGPMVDYLSATYGDRNAVKPK